MGVKLIFWALALLTLVVLGMQFGIRQAEFRLTGPFAAETTPPTHALTLTVPEEHAAAWWMQPLIGDSHDKPFESRLTLKINGITMGPAHTQPAYIRARKSAGFSHWGDHLIFSLPPEVENTATTIAVLQYAVRPRPWVALVFLVPTALFGCLLYREQLRRRWRSEVVRRRAVMAATLARKATYLVLFGLCCVGLVGVAIFLISSAFAFTEGWALPTTAPIRWWPLAHWAAANEPYLPYFLLTLAGLGTLTGWSTGFVQPRPIERNEARLQQIISWAGFPIAMCAFALCLSATWSGLVRGAGGLEMSAMGGLIPLSDAFGHLAAAFDQAKDGTFSEFAMRRPYAASQRSILLFLSHYSLPAMLLLQACLLGAAAWWASCAVMAWRGLWAGVAFFSFTYIYVRVFAPTTLTEPLGLFWALLSIPFFVASIRAASVGPALVGFALTAFALMTRMGNMFAVPALMLWLVWQFGRGLASKARIGLLSIAILLAVLALNSLLQKAYGPGYDSTGSNFSYVVCGLTLGTTWDGCPKKLEEKRGPTAPALSEQAMVAQMYSMAWDNFQAHPEVFFQRLGAGIRFFYSQFPGAIWRGYSARVDEPDWFLRPVLVVLILTGLWFVAARQANAIELSFWALLGASLTASAAIVALDDGIRVLAASHPLIVLLLAAGFATPSLKQPAIPHGARLTLHGSLGLLLAAILMAMIPWIAHRISPAAATTTAASPSRTGDALVYGGRRISGFLVVADGELLRSDTPTIHISDFSAIVALSRVEVAYQGLLHPVAPPLPFGFVTAPRMERGVGTNQYYIVPAEVMEKRDVPAWRFETAPWNHKEDVKGNYWVNVTRATPLIPNGQ